SGRTRRSAGSRMRRCAAAARSRPRRRTSGTSSPSSRPAGHDRAHLEHVVVADNRVAGQELVTSDDEHGAWHDRQRDEKLLDAALAADLDLSSGVAQNHLHDDVLLRNCGLDSRSATGETNYSDRRGPAQRFGMAKSPGGVPRGTKEPRMDDID